MCNFWGCVIDKNGKIYWDKNTSSHEDLIKAAGLKDDKLENRDFVRIEISPAKPIHIFSKQKKDWKFNVDEEGTLPAWYTAKRKRMEGMCWKEWETAMQQTLWKLDLTTAEKFIKHIKDIPYFLMRGKIKAEWNMSWGKTWSAAYLAAGSAADSAAGSAAWLAAWSAAYSAAYSAARSAADSAALYVRCLLTLKLGLEKKHFLHAKARMEVWEAGYGLRCDMNGKLYCYGVKNDEEAKTK